MSTWFKITIEERDGARVRLRLDVVDAVNGDYFPEEASWALRLLSEATWAYIRGSDSAKRKASPLGAALNPETENLYVPSADLLALYIESVSVLEKHGFPIKDKYDYNNRDLGSSPETSAWACYEIVATDPKWVEHLSPGLTWDSCA